MKERIQSLIGQLTHEATQEQAFTGLEEAVTGDGVADRAAEVLGWLEDGWRRLGATGRFEPALRLIDIASVLVAGAAEEARLLKEQARILDEELFDQRAALEKLQLVAGLDPSDVEVPGRIEAIESERANWKEIVERFTADAAETTEPSLKAHLLYGAAERTYKNHRRGKEIPTLLKAALDADGGHLKAARLLERVLTEREKWDDLAELYMRLSAERTSKDERVQMLLAAAYTYGHRLEDMDSAALCYSEVLDFQPGNQAALRFVVKYYEDREDWDHLVAVYEDALRGRLDGDDEAAMLMQAGMVHWKMREDLDAAEGYFRRLRKLQAAHPGMINFYRAYCKEKGASAKLLQILTDAQRVSTDPKQCAQLNAEIAELASADGGNTEKAIDAYKQMLRANPQDVRAREQLKLLYRQTEKWNNLIDALKSEVETLPADDAAGRIALYEEMVEIYRDQLQLEMMVVKMYDAILQLDPGNRAALDELARTYEAAGRWSDLIGVLARQVEVEADPARQVELLNRVAGLWVERFNNFNRAVEPLERILELDGTNRQAIETLKGVYEKRRAWKPLLDLLERETALHEGERLRDHLAEMARLAAERLSDQELAVALWRRVIAIDPQAPEALATIERLTERLKDWDGLVEVLELRIAQAGDEEEQVAHFTKLGTVLKDRVRDPGRAAEAWRRLLEMQPGNNKAVRSLRDAYQAAGDWEALERLYAEAGDFEALVEVLGTAADRVPDDQTKLQLSFRCAELYEDPIGQPERAVRHYERVLAVDPANERAARALAPIYRRTEKWSRLAGVLEGVLASAAGEERMALLGELRELAATRLNNRTAAFQWAARALEEAPADPSIRAEAEQAAEQCGAWDRLVALYERLLERFEGSERLALERHVATLTLERLGNVDDAVARYQLILEERPGDGEALDALDRIYRTTANWDELAGIYRHRLELAGDPQRRRELTLELARLYEEGMDEPIKAAAEYRAVLEIDPRDREALTSLERIFRIREQWDDLAEILERRRQAVTLADDDWREISLQIAELFDQRLGDKPRSIAIFRELLETRPGDVPTIEAMDRFLRDEQQRVAVARFLEPHLRQAADWRRLAWALAILIENSEDRAERLELNTGLAEIYGERLGDPRLAFDTLGAALRENPGDVAIWDRMTELAETLDLLPELAEKLGAAYAAGELDDDRALDLARRLAGLLDGQLGRRAEAEPYHRKVLDHEPDNAAAFLALTETFTAAERWSDLLALYREALGRDLGDEARLDLLLKICFITDDVLRDVPASIDAYVEVLRVSPGNPEATRALCQLYEDAGRWDDLAALIGEQLAGARDEEAVQLRYRLGEIAEHFQRRPEEAIEHYELVIFEDPDHLKAQDALERLLESPQQRLRAARILEATYAQQGAAEPLARVLLVELEDADLAAAQRIDILTRVADLKERRLGDVGGAFEALSKALETEPANEPVATELSRLAADHGLEAELAALLDRMIPAVADDPRASSRLMAEVARIYDERLGNLDRAEASYRRLLDHDPDDPETALPAVAALDRLLTAAEKWTELLSVLRNQVRLTDDPLGRREVLHRMAEIEESVLDRVAEAVLLYREILDEDETDARALSGLERLYDREGQWPELIEVLRRRAVLEASADLRRELYLRVARLFEERIGDPAEAIAAYRQVNDEIGADREALGALARLYREAERWTDLLEAYEAEEPLLGERGERARMLFTMGDLLRTRIGDFARAVERLGEALAIDPTHAEARASLEALLDSPVKMEAIRLLRPVCEAEGDYERLIRFAEIQAGEADDPLERARALKEAAEVAEVGLADPGRAFELLGRAFRHGTADPELPALIDGLERLAGQVDGYPALVGLYREVVPDILDGELQVRCFLRAAELAHGVIGDVDTAREYYVKVLDMDGENRQAMDALERIYEEHEQWLELFEIYRRQVQITFDEAARRAILFRQARVCELNLEDVSGAAQTYEQILEGDALNEQAIEALERIYPRLERWADLMEILDRKVGIRAEGRVDLLHRMGRLAGEHLGDEERALECYRRALDEDPNHGPTLASLEAAMGDDTLKAQVAEILEPVYKLHGDWAKLARALDARLELTDDPADRKDLLRRIGMVYEEQLGDLDHAFDTYARLFGEDPEDGGSLDLLTRLGGVLENWGRQAEVFAGVLEDVVADTPATAGLAFTLGELYEKRLDDAAAARAAYQRVLAFSPDDPRAFAAVERMLLATEAWTDLLELYRDAADAALDTEQRKQFLYKIAGIHEQVGEDLDAAITAYRGVLEIDERDGRATESLDRLYRQAGRLEDLGLHIRAQVDLAPDAERRNEQRRRLARVHEEDLKDLDSAVDVYEEALLEAGGDPGSLAELERLILEETQRRRIAEILEPVYRDADEWKKLVVILKVKVEFLDAPAERVACLREMAELHERRGGNYLLAFGALAQAFEADPREREVLEELVRLAEHIDNWDELARTVEAQLENIYDVDLKHEALHLLGSTYDRRLDQPRKAIEAYRAALEIDETDAPALEALEGLFNLVGEWDGLVDVLARKAELASDPAERCELLRAKASIHEDLMGAPADAIESYRRALEADPASLPVLAALERLYESAGAWTELVEARRQRLELAVEPAERIEVLRSIATILETRLDEAFEAITGWRAVLEEDGRDPEAIAALDRLYTREKMHAELLDNLVLQKSIANDQAAWVDLGTRIGRLQETELGDLEGAIESYRDVLAQQPTHAGAIDALERLARDEAVRALAIDVLEPLHREAGRYDRLAALLELRLELVEDPAERFAQLAALAEVQESGRSDPAAAFGVYARALAADPARFEVLDSLERIAAAEGLWKRLDEVYAGQAREAYDPAAERELLGRLGGLREMHLGDPRGAIEAYRRIFDSGEPDGTVLAALDRLYEREGLFAELDEVIEREIGQAPDAAERHGFRLRQGAIRERQFGDLAGAIGAYRDVVEQDPVNDDAVAALEGLLARDEAVAEAVEALTPAYQARGEQHKIGRLFEARLRVADETDRVPLYRELAAYQEQVIGDPSAAFDSLARAFALTPADRELLGELERLAADLGSWAALVRTTEQALEGGRLEPSHEVELGLQVARWAAGRVGDPLKAEARYRAVLEREPDHAEALDALIELLQGLGRFEDLLAMLERKAEATYDFSEKKRILFQAARVAQFDLGRAEPAVRALRELLALDETDVEALDALIALTEQQGDFAALVELLVARGRFTADPAQAGAFRHRAATLYVGPLAEPARAVDVYREILETEPGDDNARSQLQGLYERLERWNDLKDLLIDQLDRVTGDEARIEVLGRLARLAEERFDDPAEAAEHLREVLMLAPFDEAARGSLERIYARTERWHELVEVLEGAADREREAGNVTEELTLLVRIGEIFDGRLSEPERATDIYERVLERDPEHTRALAALARLYEAAEEWERCAEVLQKAAAAGRGGPDEAEVHFRLARLSESRLGDEAAALAQLQRAVELDPGHREANRALAAKCLAREDWPGLLAAWQREEPGIEDRAARVARLLEIATLQEAKLADPAGAVATLLRARELAPADPAVLLALSDGLLNAGRQDEAIPVLESLIDAETDGGRKRSKQAATYQQRLAMAHLARGDQDQALAGLEAAYKMDISNLEVLISLGRLHYDRGDLDAAVKLFRALLLQRFERTAGASKADIYWYVGDISLRQGDPRKAKGMFQRGLDEDPGHEGCKAGIEQCK
jgi:tetratricopeptide (TPR) repeat protein